MKAIRFLRVQERIYTAYKAYETLWSAMQSQVQVNWLPVSRYACVSAYTYNVSLAPFYTMSQKKTVVCLILKILEPTSIIFSTLYAEGPSF